MPKEAIQQQRAVILLHLPVSNIPLISESLLTYIIQHINS
jgi:hypothetical protein